jgi:hypothetical protein
MLDTQSLVPDNPVDYPAILNDFHRAGVGGLNNGLSDDDNARLFQTDDIGEMVALVLKGLANRQEALFEKRRHRLIPSHHSPSQGGRDEIEQ